MISFFCVVFKCDDEINIFKLTKDINEIDELKYFLANHANGLKGYNNIFYDSQLIEFIRQYKGVLTPIILYQFSQKVIESKYPIYNENRLTIFNLDIYKILHLDNKNRMVGLKWCEFMTDWHNIEDMPHHHTKHLNSEEEVETITYCINDVEATEHLFNQYQKEQHLRLTLTDKYGINFMNSSNSRIGSELILKLYSERTGRNASELRRIRTERSSILLGNVIFPYIKFHSETFSSFLEHLRNKNITINKDQKDKDKIKLGSVTYKGFRFDYGLGGIHGSLRNKIVTVEEDEILIDADVASLYPSIAVVNELFPQHLGKEFAEVYNEDIVSVRLGEKAKGKDGDKAIIDGFKEAANASYGKSNDYYSWMYDPQYTYATTINGQLMLTMLAEELMEIPTLEMIQINTDGLTCKLKRDYIHLYQEICQKWEKLTNLILEYAEYSKMMIRDVNNYIAVYTNGKTKCKGAYEIENIPLHKNKSEMIIRIAVFNWFTQGIPIEDTINNHTNLLDFCIGSKNKQGSKFFYLDKNAKEHNLSKTIRYYISTKGVVIKKRFDDGRTQYLNVHPQKGKTYYQTLLNKYTKEQVTDCSLVNHTYYIHKVKEELFPFQEKLTLF